MVMMLTKKKDRGIDQEKKKGLNIVITNGVVLKLIIKKKKK